MHNPRRLAMPLSAALVAVFALSACSSSVNSVAPSSSAASPSSGSASASETASPSASASSSTSASASASSSATSKALTDDNKAGKPRPTSTYGDPYPGATVHEDGSWEYKSESYTMTTKADGTWEWTNNKGDKANLNADGTWESFDAQRNERVHVNPDGSWIRVRESGDTDLTKGAKGMEVKADGTWRSVDSYSTLYGTADGKVYQEKPGQEKREVGKELTPTTVPVNPIAYAEGGVGGNSVVPLKPRTPLKPGEKAQ